MEKVKVILSTYNGEKYIREQINSIIIQKDICPIIYIRDDGSIDRTRSIIREYTRTNHDIHLISGKNEGCLLSFFEALKFAYEDKEHANYYAFCDQDDVWLPDKLITGVKMIKATEKLHNTPCLYCSNLELVDSKLESIGLMNDGDKNPSIYTALIDNIVTGCTMIVNQNLVENIMSHPLPKNAAMHDWWIYLVAVFFGKVIYDKTPHIKYRQHSTNVLGGVRGSIIQRVANFFSNWQKDQYSGYRKKMAIDFLNIYGKELNEDSVSIVKKVAEYDLSIINQFKLILDKKIKYKSFISNLSLISRIFIKNL